MDGPWNSQWIMVIQPGNIDLLIPDSALINENGDETAPKHEGEMVRDK